MSKYDGVSRRPLIPNEFQQMAGRAGRRGIDEQGHVGEARGGLDVAGEVGAVGDLVGRTRRPGVAGGLAQDVGAGEDRREHEDAAHGD